MPEILGDFQTGDKRGDSNEVNSGWSGVVSELAAKGSMVGEKIKQLREFQLEALEQQMNLVGRSKETLVKLSIEELDNFTDLFIKLSNCADKAAATTVSKKIADIIK